MVFPCMQATMTAVAGALFASAESLRDLSIGLELKADTLAALRPLTALKRLQLREGHEQAVHVQQHVQLAPRPVSWHVLRHHTFGIR